MRIVLDYLSILVSTTYNVVLAQISRQQSFTYLPICSNPPPPLQYRVIVIGCVNDNDFVRYLLHLLFTIKLIIYYKKFFLTYFML